MESEGHFHSAAAFLILIL